VLTLLEYCSKQVHQPFKCGWGCVNGSNIHYDHIYVKVSRQCKHFSTNLNH